MSNWFQIKSNYRVDARLRILTADEHRVWFNLLCYAAEQKPNRGAILNYDAYVVAIEVANGDTELLIRVLDKLSKLCIINVNQSISIVFCDFNNIKEPEYRKEWRSVSRELSPAIFSRDDYMCTYCGAKEYLTIDHILPLSRGGSSNKDNLTTACRSCNSRKHNKTIEEWNNE